MSLKSIGLICVVFFSCNIDNEFEVLSSDLYINKSYSSKVRLESGKKYILYVEGNIDEYSGNYSKELQVSIKNDALTIINKSYWFTHLDKFEMSRNEMMYSETDSLDFMKNEFAGILATFTSDRNGLFQVTMNLNVSSNIKVNKLRVSIQK